MLTLTRKLGETVRIGDDIEIKVKEIRRNQVRLSIVCPREVKVYRMEVYENILSERRQPRQQDTACSHDEGALDEHGECTACRDGGFNR